MRKICFLCKAFILYGKIVITRGLPRNQRWFWGSFLTKNLFKRKRKAPDQKIKCFLCWHLPIFPGRFQPSIVGASELNCRVRDGNGCTLTAINTNSSQWAMHPPYISSAYAEDTLSECTLKTEQRSNRCKQKPICAIASCSLAQP